MSSIISRLVGFGTRGAASGNPLDDRYYTDAGPGAYSIAGVRVSAETALKVSAVYRCVSIISNTIAMLPKGIYEELDPVGRRRAKEQPMDVKLRLQPNARQTSFEFFRQLYVSLTLRQNAFAQMVPIGAGAVDLIPLHPDRMDGPKETPSGRLLWEFRRNDGTKVPLIDGVDLWHLKGLSDDGLKGLSLLDLGRDSIGLASAAERHAARFFERGAKFGGVLEHPKTLKPETAREMSESFGRTYGGEIGAGRTPVLWEGMQFKTIAMNNKDAEFLDSRKFGVTDIARWFGVPPHLVGDVEKTSSWGTGIEEQNLGFLVYSLLPWITLLEQSARMTLLVNPERYYLKCAVNVILRMSAKAQMDVFALAISNGILNPNECRELMELNPREGGDEYLSALNMRLGAGNPPAGGGAPPPQQRQAAAIAARLAEELDRHDGGAATSTSVGRAGTLARWCAAQVLAREAEELRGLSTKTGGNTERWGHAVASFYGRHATYVAEALSVTPEEARAYCREQQETVTASGCPASMETWTEARLERLVAMAAGEVRA